MTDDISAPSVSPYQDAGAHSEQEAFVKHIDDKESDGSVDPLGIIFAGAVVAVVVIEFFVSLMLTGGAQTKIDSATREIDNQNKILQSPDLQKTQKYATDLAVGIKSYNTLKQTDRDYDPVFSEIKKRVVKNTRLKAFSLDEKGVVKMDAEAIGFADVAGFLASFKNATPQVFTNVELASLTFSDKTKTFSVTAKYTPVQKQQATGAGSSGTTMSPSAIGTPAGSPAGATALPTTQP